MSEYTYPPSRVKPTCWLIMTYVREYLRSFELMPTPRRVAEAFGISRQRAYYFIWALEKDGLL